MSSSPISASTPRAVTGTASTVTSSPAQSLAKQETLLRATTEQLSKTVKTLNAKGTEQAAAPAQSQSSQQADGDKPTAEQAITELGTKYAGYVGSLGDKAGNRALTKAQEKTDAFIKANPNATKEQINEVAKKEFNKSTAAEYIFKSAVEKSMGDIMAKVQEAIDEQGK
ncbi:hypothetical protein [Corallococcus aberystwythensis]|uniref:Uncharacterized protein n=1 Tax=Corallococcus aberystwythensis TaxID=2316722 RepID=A0A3A8PZ64_9BACT|nr:hypothetical protein [Corallococcus aberystwythensis]RKH60381.1 hypothetical protein D7W81_25735 [Corallococcus aberystwythensis]